MPSFAFVSARYAADAEADFLRISASQEDLLARAPFITFNPEEDEEEEAEVSSTPPLTHQAPQRQGEEGIAMCSMPFTQPPSPSPAPSPPLGSPSRERFPSLGDSESEAGHLKAAEEGLHEEGERSQAQDSDAELQQPSPSPEVDPLARAVLVTPTTPSAFTSDEDILELARSRDI
ncbi:hypothetical protein Zm00014a_017283 [Zea mays]|uniref:Uncharacterized protein n=1 Tax=Zea mays TaxID=4577 RepID=A0A3L6G8I3_MAIZE|nr:hypothetical protein Zm00014a_017283 [Zea mays]